MLELVPQEQRSYLQQIIQGSTGVPEECLTALLPPLPIPESDPIPFTVTSAVDISENPHKHARRPPHAEFSKIVQRKKVKRFSGKEDENYEWQIEWRDTG